MEYKSKIVMVFGILPDTRMGWASRRIIEIFVLQKHTTSGYILASPPLNHKVLIINIQAPNIYLPKSHPEFPVSADQIS